MSSIIVGHKMRNDNRDRLLGRLTVRQAREAVHLKEHMQQMDFFEFLRVVPEEDRQFAEFLGLRGPSRRVVNGTLTNA